MPSEIMWEMAAQAALVPDVMLLTFAMRKTATVRDFWPFVARFAEKDVISSYHQIAPVWM
jgi:hypothetical protein